MPTECSQDSLDFASLGGRKVTAAFDGGAMTSNAGALLLRETDRAIGLSRQAAACFSDGRRQDRIEHGTSHGLSSAFLAFQAGIEQRAVFEHGAGDVEKTVADGAQSASMAATAGFQSKIFGFALLIASSGSVSQVVNRIPQSWIAGKPSGDSAAFARSPGDGGHAAQFA